MRVFIFVMRVDWLMSVMLLVCRSPEKITPENAQAGSRFGRIEGNAKTGTEQQENECFSVDDELEE